LLARSLQAISALQGLTMATELDRIPMARAPIKADVVVVGAGVAGLAAARDLRSKGLSVAVVEARRRLGGRVRTLHPASGGCPIELGAEFVHGRPEALLSLVRSAGLSLVETSGSDWCVRPGVTRACDSGAVVERVMSRLSEAAGRDESFREFVEAREWGDDLEFAVTFVEGFHAARADRISVQYLAESERTAASIEGDRSFRILDGYDRIVASLAAGLDRSSLHFDTTVQRIVWEPGAVRIAAVRRGDGDEVTFAARAAIITLPLGVLKASPGSEGAVVFAPDPERIRAAIDKLEMGNAVHLALRFRERFWDRHRLAGSGGKVASDLGFLFAVGEAIPVWWTNMPILDATLTGWVGGPGAECLAGATTDGLVERAIGTLSRIFAMRAETLRELVVKACRHDWQADPFARGAYSYVPVGAHDARIDLATPVERTLYFAGEAVHIGGQTGTVHGAILSGQRAARLAVEHAKASVPASPNARHDS
jgi:monoamine oxidase